METNYTQNTAAEFFAGFEENSGKILLFRQEMLSLVEHSFTERKLKDLHDITFTAKYINGIKRAINSAANNPEIKNADDLKKDLSIQVGKLIEQLKLHIAETDEEFQAHIKETFLDMNPQAFINLTNLLSDLEQLKIYFNRLRQVQ